MREMELLLKQKHLDSTLLPIKDIQQLNLIMELLGKPSEEFMDKISSDSVIIKFQIRCTVFLISAYLFGLNALHYGFLSFKQKLF